MDTPIQYESRERIIQQFLVGESSLKKCSPQERIDREIVYHAVSLNGNDLKYASKALRNDFEIVLTAVLENGLAIRHASDSLKKNTSLIKTALRSDPKAAKYIPNSQLNDDLIKRFLLQRNNATFDISFAWKIQYFPIEFRSDKNFFETAYLYNPLIVRYASENITRNKEFMMKVVAHNGHAISCASEKLKDDFEVAFMAVLQSPHSYEFLSERLKQDKTILKAIRIKGFGLLEWYWQHVQDFECEFCPSYESEKFDWDLSWLADAFGSNDFQELFNQLITDVNQTFNVINDFEALKKQMIFFLEKEYAKTKKTPTFGF